MPMIALALPLLLKTASLSRPERFSLMPVMRLINKMCVRELCFSSCCSRADGELWRGEIKNDKVPKLAQKSL